MNEPITNAPKSGYVHLTADEKEIFKAILAFIWQRAQATTPQEDGYNYHAHLNETVKLNGNGWAAINSLMKKL